ncbi:metallophosphoesterase family protein [Bradyrhizobium sp. WSM471]|uniref:metallophosphoesterase family protein n=1 Tax=Bradyrhizobium sp. WSM471 TaxID=319017 RepID=UPI00024D24E2|nr:MULTISPECIES: metallophosphoesterase family protein [Bradyrhizobium]EHR00949.1 hypothetical protein Bra471DRAFT_01599 [Bradyrhizobium sp. WSM471]UFW43011.1 metallophosphatase family protein [Bradyrhizobium canariense]
MEAGYGVSSAGLQPSSSCLPVRCWQVLSSSRCATSFQTALPPYNRTASAVWISTVRSQRRQEMRRTWRWISERRRWRRIAPVTAIRGNVDSGEWARQYPDTTLVRLAGKSIYVLHDLKTLQDDLGAGIDVIVCGHSHVPKINTVGGVLYLNPGSAGRRRFKLPITLATLEVTPEGMRPEIHDLGGD